MKQIIFVYGTLMKGQRNNHLLKDSVYLGDGVLNDYMLYEVATFPGAVKRVGSKVYGELYEVDDDVKKIIDILEDVDNLYRYVLEDVVTDDGIVRAGLYEFIDRGIKYPVFVGDEKWKYIDQDNKDIQIGS